MFSRSSIEYLLVFCQSAPQKIIYIIFFYDKLILRNIKLSYTDTGMQGILYIHLDIIFLFFFKKKVLLHSQYYTVYLLYPYNLHRKWNLIFQS